MLTGMEIIKRVEKGEIVISDFDPAKVNPNSYNLHLDSVLKQYAFDKTIITNADGSYDTVSVAGASGVLDCKQNNPTIELKIPENGFIVLQPGILYLGSTIEYTSCENLIPCIDGRSSIGRLGIQVHATAGFGDVGFKGKWTLELSCIHPIRIYAGMEICQIYFEEPVGDTSIKYRGKYQNQDGAISSKLFTEFSK